jgi:phospholipase B-like protein
MRKEPLVTRHTRTNGNTSICLKTKKGAPAHSTLLALGRRPGFSLHLVPFLLVALVAFGLLLTTRIQTANAAPARIARQDSTYDVTLGRGYRFDRGGWTYVHLEGAPHDIGVQHGYLMAPEIADFYGVVRLEMTHNTSRSWEFFRRAGREMLWPKIDAEYQQELQGITDGLNQHGLKLDLWDVVAMNAFAELPDYYVPWLNQQTKDANAAHPADRPVYGHCSAFVATGSWTKDHRIVMGHNNWTSYVEGARWRVVFDIVPRTGYRVLMDGLPGIIASDDDFGVNTGGLMITETTIARFHGWDPNGKPEFVRARKAMQYAGSIDEFTKIMLDGNNGGYANDWLLADRKTGEIARIELGLRHTKLWRTTDGYFAGSNFPTDPDVIKDDTTFNPDNPSSSPNARHVRWDQLINENKGKIDTNLAEVFLSDHYDAFTKQTGPNLRTLCGHGESSSEGEPAWDVKPYDPSGAVQGKVIDSRMAEAMTFTGRIGHPCGTDFDAAKFLSAHHDYSWESPIMEDMDTGPWTQFRIGEHAAPLASAPASTSGGK